MKKLLLVALLLLAMVFTMVACQDTEKPEETTGDKPFVTDEPTEKPTEAPTEDPDEDTQAPTTPDTPAPTDPDTPAPTDPAPTEPATPAPTEPVVTEPPTEPETADPDEPIGVYGPDALVNFSTSNCNPSEKENPPVASEDGSYITVTPVTSDYYYYPFANVKGGRFVAIKYRTNNAKDMAIQFYIGSTGAGPSDDSSMMKQRVITDGEWQVAIFDTQALIDAGKYDGSTVAYFRFDPLDCDYILDADGNTQKDENGTFIRAEKPEGAYIDVAYIAFFNSAEAVEKYEMAPLYIAGPTELAAGSASLAVITDKGSYALFDGNVDGNGDGWVMALNGGSVPGKFISVVYRTTASYDGMVGEFFAGSGAGAVGGSSSTFNYNNDGNWHYAVVDASAHPDLTGNMAYIRYDFFNNTAGQTIDVAYVAIHASAAQAEAYAESFVATMPNLELATDIPFHTSVDFVNGSGPNGTANYSGRGGNTNAGCDVIDGAADGKTVGLDNIVSVGGWCGTSGGIARYVWTVDGITWFTAEGGKDGEPVAGHYAGIGFDEDALKNGLFNGGAEAKADLSAYAGQTVDVTFGVEPNTAPGKVVAFVKVTGLKVPGDDTHNFVADITTETAETLSDTEIGKIFTLMEALNPVNTVIPGTSYQLAGFCELYTQTNGKYAFSSNIISSSSEGFASMFVRGIRAFDFGDAGYFGQDGNDAGATSSGCAGIYVIPVVQDEVLKLRISIKTLNENGFATPDVTYVDIDSTDITLADDGQTVYVIAGGKLVATIAISGTHDYAVANVAADACAEKVVLTLADGTSREIANPVVAASYLCDVGFGVRGGASMVFDSFSLVGYSTVEIPEFPKKPETPAEILNAAYALEAGATLADGPYTLTGVVKEITDPYTDKYKNVTFTMIVDDLTHYPIVVFRAKGEGADTLKEGDTVTITGEIVNWENKDGTTTVEFNSGCAIDEIVVATTVPAFTMGENAAEVEADGQFVGAFTAKLDGTYVITWAEGETNGYIAIEIGNETYILDSETASCEFTLASGEAATVAVMTADYAADTVNFVIAAAEEEAPALALGDNEVDATIPGVKYVFNAKVAGTYTFAWGDVAGYAIIEKDNVTEEVELPYTVTLADRESFEIIIAADADGKVDLVITAKEPDSYVALSPEEAGLVKIHNDAVNADNYSSSIAGWMGFKDFVPTDLGWAIDGGAITWDAGNTINTGCEAAIKDPGNAGANGFRFTIKADLTTVDYGAHRVTYYAKSPDGDICAVFEQDVTTKDPSVVGNSEIKFNSAETADLMTVFTNDGGAPGATCNYKDNTAAYKLTGITSIHAAMDGTYEITVKGLTTPNGHGAMFFRGNPNPNFGDAGYFGHDGNNAEPLSVGCAGIYVSIVDNAGTPTLRINVKGEADGKAIPHIYTVALTGRDIKVVDDNKALTFYEGDKLIATVAISGMDASGYAEKAVVTIGETVETLEDVCCAATAASDFGFVARGVDTTFTALTINGLAE